MRRAGTYLIHGCLSPPESHTPNGIAIGSAFFAGPLNMEGSIVFARLRQCASHVTRTYLGSPESTTQTVSRSVHPFLDSSRLRVAILYNGSPLPPIKIVPFHEASEPPSNTWFPGPTRILNPNVISIASDVLLHGSLLWHCARQTDRPRYAVYNNRPHLRT